VDLNRHLNTRVRKEQKHAYDFHNGSFTLLKSVEVVQRFDFYGYSPHQHHYARLTFTSLGAHLEARWALSSLTGSKDRGPSLRSNVLHRIFPGRTADLDGIYAGRKGVVRKGLSLVLGEANIEFHDQVRRGLRPLGPPPRLT
jgi:hypothetical protein